MNNGVKDGNIQIYYLVKKGGFMIKAVLFDLDGTIADTLMDLADSANHVLQQNGYPTHNTECYKVFVGNGIAKLIERVLPEQDRTQQNVLNLKTQFVEYYTKHYCDKTKPYKGVPQMLDALKQRGIKIAVVTNKAQPMAQAVVDRLYGKNFCSVYGQREDMPTKPNPALTILAMSDLSVEPSQCLFVGDSNVDIYNAINSGAYPVGVLWGFRSEEELKAAGAKAILSRPEQLLELI